MRNFTRGKGRFPSGGKSNGDVLTEYTRLWNRRGYLCDSGRRGLRKALPEKTRGLREPSGPPVAISSLHKDVQSPLLSSAFSLSASSLLSL